MKEVTYIEEFYDGCNTTVGTAMQVLGGDQWKDVYALMTEHDVLVVGGNSQTVGAAGGYSLGGGHSALGPLYGLAADNILEVDVVLANGTLVTANQCQY